MNTVFPPSIRRAVRSVRLVRIGGILVRLDAGWALVVACLAWSLASGRFPSILPTASATGYWTGGLVAVVLVLASVALHEIAHALVAHVYGVRVSSLTLHVFGGVSEASRPPHPLADAIIAVVGPVVSFAAAASALVTRHASAQVDWAAALLGYVALVNLAIALVNLIPGFPLDGGRLLRALLWWWTGSAAGATMVATRVGVGFAAVLLVLGASRLYVRDIAGGTSFAALGVLVFHAARSRRDVSRARRRVDAMPRLDRVA